MKKSDRIHALLQSNASQATGDVVSSPYYTGWFLNFNQAEFYTAHDVLEQLWLQTRDANWSYFKGLIQLAGAFVHLKKQHERPFHPKDGRRLNPAARLFDLARDNLSPFAPRHLGVNVELVCELCQKYAHAIRESDYQVNPWTPDTIMRVELSKHAG